MKKSEQSSIVLFSTVAVQSGYTFHTQVAASSRSLKELVERGEYQRTWKCGREACHIMPAENRTIDSGMLPVKFQDERAKMSTQIQVAQSPKPRRESVAALEKEAIENALILCGWNQSKAS